MRQPLFATPLPIRQDWVFRLLGEEEHGELFLTIDPGGLGLVLLAVSLLWAGVQIRTKFVHKQGRAGFFYPTAFATEADALHCERHDINKHGRGWDQR